MQVALRQELREFLDLPPHHGLLGYTVCHWHLPWRVQLHEEIVYVTAFSKWCPASPSAALAVVHGLQGHGVGGEQRAGVGEALNVLRIKL